MSRHTWTLITVSYNSAATLERCWAGLTFPPGVRWVVVDNASSDGSAGVAAALGAEVIALDENVGFSRANNLALRRTSSEYVGFLNPDVRPDLASLDRLADVASESHDLVSPQLVNPDGSLQPNGRGLPYLHYKLLNRMSPERVADRYYVLAEPDEVRDAVWSIGAAVMAERSVIEEIGGWDERFFIYYEDSDLGLRAQARGHGTRIVGSERWVHEWARATTRFRWAPWRREIASASRFYSRYPHLALPFLKPRAVATRGGAVRAGRP